MLFPIQIVDINYTDIFFGYSACINPFLHEERLQTNLTSFWGNDRCVMTTLSVRSGFYLLLETLALPVGSEIIMSGITVPDMPLIAEKHGLNVVPIDLFMRDLRVKENSLTNAITSKTRVIVIAHLYGAIINMDPICKLLSHYPDIYLIEDCAQAFSGLSGYRGHPRSDLLLYSFGTIKTATALGGGVLLLKDANLRDQMTRIHQSWPLTKRTAYVKKLTKGLVLRLGSIRLLMQLFIWYCKFSHKNITQVILGLFRGFQGDNLFQLICRRPSLPLLAMLKRRLCKFDQIKLNKRVERFNFVKKHLKPHVLIHGINNPTHSNWVCALTPKYPDHLVTSARALGIYCFLGSPQIKAISGTTFKDESTECVKAMTNVVYVPITNNMSDSILIRLTEVINRYA